MSSESILRLAEVRVRVGLSTSTIYARMSEGDFPKVRRDRGVSFWLASEIDEYVEKVVRRATVGPGEVKRRKKTA